MVSGSDDFTMFLWNPAKEKKSLARLTGKIDKEKPSSCGSMVSAC